MRKAWIIPFALAMACSSSSESGLVGNVDSGDSDASDGSDLGLDAPSETSVDAPSETSTDGSSAALRSCPTTGVGGVAGDICYLLTPAETGLPPNGVNAAVDQYVLRPLSGARGKLMIFFNGSGGDPRAGTHGTATTNFYSTARSAGLHVIGLSYSSNDAIGTLCKADDACFLPSRRAILTGKFEPGAASELSAIAAHEGAYARLIAALTSMSAADPAGGWEAFLNSTGAIPDIRWSLVFAAGHSQGGGHAALVGRSFPIERVIALSSPCDRTAAGAATWLDVTKSQYFTNPSTSFHGLGAQGDTICPGYPAAWDALGLDPSRRHSDAVVCAGSQAHGASISCPENAATWAKMMQ